MEVLGLLLAIPVAFGVSALYSLFAALFLSGQGAVGVIVRVSSWFVIATLSLEVAGLLALGAVRLHDRLGWPFTVVHSLVLLLAAPAVANLVARVGRARGWNGLAVWAVAASACFLVAVSLLFGNVVISEWIYGVDGLGVRAQ
jgi:hypothetical protein